MTKKRTLQILRGTTLQNNAYTGSAGELTMDTTRNELRLHDGSTAGGHKVGINTANASDGYFLSYNTTTHDVVWKPLQLKTLPTATITNAGAVVQYIGVDTVDLTHNYFYESVFDLQKTTTTGFDVAVVDQKKFADFLEQEKENTGGEEVTSFSVKKSDTDVSLSVQCYSASGPSSMTHMMSQAALTSYCGLEITGTVTTDPATYNIFEKWERTDVQPEIDFTAITGFDSTVKQMLVHDANSSSLKWETIA